MADRTIKPDDTNDLVLQNNDGSAKLELNEDQTVKVTTGSDAGEDFTVNASQLVVEGDTGNIGIGTNSPSSLLHIESTGSPAEGIRIQSGSGNNDAGLSFYNSTTLKWNIRNNGNNHELFIIPSSTNDSDSAVTITQAGNVTVNSGNVVIGTAGKGIDFSVNSTENVSSASNVGKVLMDFEEGEFSPAIKGESGSSSGLSATRNGHYTRIGDIVHVTIFIQNSSWTSGPSGTAYIGLPFTVKANFSSAGTLGYVNNFTKTPQRINAFQNTAKLYLFKYNTSSVADNSGFTNLDGSEVNSNSEIYAQVTYRVA